MQAAKFSAPLVGWRLGVNISLNTWDHRNVQTKNKTVRVYPLRAAENQEEAPGRIDSPECDRGSEVMKDVGRLLGSI